MTSDMWAPLITGGLLLVMSVVLQRGLRRHDGRLRELRTSEEKIERDKAAKRLEHEARLSRMERTLVRHTRSLATLSRGQQLAVETAARHSSDLEQLEEATIELGATIRIAERRIQASEHLIGQLRAERERGTTDALRDPAGRRELGSPE